MQEPEDGQNGAQHFSHLVRRKGALGKNLRERLFGVVHHEKDKRQTVEFAAARLEKLDQMRMGERSGVVPKPELSIRADGVGRHQLERGVRQVSCLEFGKK